MTRPFSLEEKRAFVRALEKIRDKFKENEIECVGEVEIHPETSHL